MWQLTQQVWQLADEAVGDWATRTQQGIAPGARAYMLACVRPKTFVAGYLFTILLMRPTTFSNCNNNDKMKCQQQPATAHTDVIDHQQFCTGKAPSICHSERAMHHRDAATIPQP